MDIRTSWCNISGFTITGAQSYSTVFMLGNHNTISDCLCIGNVIGIHLENADYNLIDNSTCQSNTGAGIYLGNSSYNTINNTKTIDSVYGFGFYWFYAFNNVLKNGVCDGNADDGLYAYWLSNGNSLENYTFNNNHGNGLYLFDSDDFTIDNCISQGNSLNGFVMESSRNIITNCSAHSNSENGFHLYHSEESTIGNCLVYNNSGRGFYLKYSDGNIITKNSVISNSDFGIKVDSSSSSNLIYNNDFVNNNHGAKQVQDNFSKTEDDYFKKNNEWDRDGSGNYWWDYSYHYPNAINNGYVWGTPYSVSHLADNQDDYPLVEPYRGRTFIESIHPDVFYDSDVDGIFDALDAFPDDFSRFRKELRVLNIGPLLTVTEDAIFDATVSITVNGVTISNNTGPTGVATLSFPEPLTEGKYQGTVEKAGFEKRSFEVTITDDGTYSHEKLVLKEEYKKDSETKPIDIFAIIIVVAINGVFIAIVLITIIFILRKRKNHPKKNKRKN